MASGPPEGPRTGVIPASEQIAARHPELDDAPLRARYALEGKLGRGGMGVVAEAHDRRIGRQVAVKRLAGPPTPEMVSRFVREARVQGRLDHPAVVPVYDLGIQSDGRPYFAMRKLTGVTLAEVLHRQGTGDAEALERYPRARLLEAFVEVCLAIEYAHTRGVLHRDLKPANVMLGDFGEVYVIDWGVATSGGAPGDPGAGTVGYMAPEIARGDPVDARSDVYALGKILTDILASPIASSTPALEVIRSRASREDRATRFASARELAEAVQRHLDADADSEARETQAGDHVARARAALAAGGADPAARATAMREAGLALALDPNSAPAARLVREMLLEPPATMPAPVEAAIRADDERLLQTRAGAAAASYMMIVGAMILFLFQGVRDWATYLLLPAVVAIAVPAALSARTGRLARSRVWIAVACNVVVMLVYSRVLGPFVLPPGIAALIAMIVLTHPTMRAWWLVVALMGLGPLAAWLLEEVGVFATTTVSEGDRLVIGATMVDLPAGLVTFGLAFYIFSLLVVGALFGRRVANAHHENRHRLAIQAWHLRRLLGRKVES